MAEAELRQSVSQALAELPAAEREIIALKFFSGMSNPEIAEATGISPSNVGTRPPGDNRCLKPDRGIER